MVNRDEYIRGVDTVFILILAVTGFLFLTFSYLGWGWAAFWDGLIGVFLFAVWWIWRNL